MRKINLTLLENKDDLDMLQTGDVVQFQGVSGSVHLGVYLENNRNGEIINVNPDLSLGDTRERGRTIRVFELKHLGLTHVGNYGRIAHRNVKGAYALRILGENDIGYLERKDLLEVVGLWQ